ncbi:MAG: dTMP kinase [Tissierellia bacterium]|nr:dTMP kinase [Tissierellia bacterium]
MRGKFLVLDGPDGSGKSTVAAGIVERYKNENKELISVREPGGTKLGEALRHQLLNGDNPPTAKAETLLFAAARAQLVEEVIMPALNEGKDVLCDRFVLSSLAYQGVGRDLGVDSVANINAFATGGLYPDLTIYLRLDPKVGLSRRSKTGAFDRIEDEGTKFHLKVGNAYDEITKLYPEHNIITIDGALPKGEVMAKVFEAIEDL